MTRKSTGLEVKMKLHIFLLNVKDSSFAVIISKLLWMFPYHIGCINEQLKHQFKSHSYAETDCRNFQCNLNGKYMLAGALNIQLLDRKMSSKCYTL